jgi:nucleoside-diphosphate-sugar epimerase
LTKQLYDAFLKSEAKKFIFISSVKASADSVEGVFTEEVEPKPLTHYGKSKLMAEEYILSQPLSVGKSYYILRPSMIHGPGNKGNLNLLYQIVKKGIPYPLAAFENKRSFLSIDNLCFVIKEILENDIPSGIYNLADDESISTNELVQEIASVLNIRPKLWKINPSLIRFIAKRGDQLKLPLNTERLNKLTESYVVFNHKIKTVLGKEFPVSAKEGLRITLESFKLNEE